MSADYDHLIPDADVAHRFKITRMTLHRWTHDPKMGFPQPILIKSRNYRSKREIAEFCERQKLATPANKKELRERLKRRIAAKKPWEALI